MSLGTSQTSSLADLWTVETTLTFQFEEKPHEGCTTACDKTRNRINKVQVKRQKWDEICLIASDDTTKASCYSLAVVRGGLALTCLAGFIYAAFACVSFAGSDNRSVWRFPMLVGVILAASSLLFLVVAIVSAFVIDGNVPRATEPLAERMNLEGAGFAFSIVAVVLSVPNLLVAILAMQVTALILGEGDEESEKIRRKRMAKTMTGSAKDLTTASASRLQAQAWS